MSDDARARVAVISVHTSPADQPGTCDSGGMNVYVRAVAKRLAEQGVAVDIYTRCKGQGGPEVRAIGRASRLILVQAGPCAPLGKEELPLHLPAFLDGVVARAEHEAHDHEHAPYDVVHSHYWLSGWVGSLAKEIWGVPLVASFHTLGKVKNAALAPDDPQEPPARLRGEEAVIAEADRILAPTTGEVEDLVGLYGADRDRIRVVPPGVDGTIFSPRPKREAKRRLGWEGRRVLLYVGRLQRFKGPDVAIRALAEAISRAPVALSDVTLTMVGGPSGEPAGRVEVAGLQELAGRLGVGDRVSFLPPRPHERLADLYSAAELVLVPSRSESFGLVALEAQSCGTPVVGAATGGLHTVVRDGVSGFLVAGGDPRAYADRIVAILTDPALTARLSGGAVRHAGGYSWEATTADIRAVYGELLDGAAA